jgi:hypothetical protein
VEIQHKALDQTITFQNESLRQSRSFAESTHECVSRISAVATNLRETKMDCELFEERYSQFTE